MSPSTSIEISLGIRYTVFKPIDDIGSPDEYLLRVKGDIVGSYILKNDEEPWEIHLGEISLLIVQHSNALDDGASLYEVFDLEHDLINAASQIYSPDFEDFNPIIQKTFPYSVPCGDFLLIDYIHVRPFARGQHLGPIAIRAAVKDWQSSCNLIAINPNPKERIEGTNHDEATRKLRSHFQLAGFKSIPGIPPLIICPAVVQNTVDLPNTIHLNQDLLPTED